MDDMWIMTPFCHYLYSRDYKLVQLALSVPLSSSQGVCLHEGAARQWFPSAHASGKQQTRSPDEPCRCNSPLPGNLHHHGQSADSSLLVQRASFRLDAYHIADQSSAKGGSTLLLQLHACRKTCPRTMTLHVLHSLPVAVRNALHDDFAPSKRATAGA